MYDQSYSTSDPKRSWLVKIDQIENARRLLQGLIKQREIEFGCDIGIGQSKYRNQTLFHVVSIYFYVTSLYKFFSIVFLPQSHFILNFCIILYTVTVYSVLT